jgi:hypothetical protein
VTRAWSVRLGGQSGQRHGPAARDRHADGGNGENQRHRTRDAHEGQGTPTSTGFVDENRRGVDNDMPTH